MLVSGSFRSPDDLNLAILTDVEDLKSEIQLFVEI